MKNKLTFSLAFALPLSLVISLVLIGCCVLFYALYPTSLFEFILWKIIALSSQPWLMFSSFLVVYWLTSWGILLVRKHPSK